MELQSSRASALLGLVLSVILLFLVMLEENNGPKMVSYATMGTSYGVVGFFLPFIALTFVKAFIAVEMIVRASAMIKWQLRLFVQSHRDQKLV